MTRTQHLLSAMALGLALSGCATHQVRFQPWQGLKRT
jgi:hypothetical protein